MDDVLAERKRILQLAVAAVPVETINRLVASYGDRWQRIVDCGGAQLDNTHTGAKQTTKQPKARKRARE